MGSATVTGRIQVGGWCNSIKCLDDYLLVLVASATHITTAALMVSASTSTSVSSKSSAMRGVGGGVMSVVRGNASDLEARNISEIRTEAGGVGTAATVEAEERFGPGDNTPFGAEIVFAEDVEPFVEFGVDEGGALDIYVETCAGAVRTVTIAFFQVNGDYFNCRGNVVSAGICGGVVFVRDAVVETMEGTI